MKRFSLLSLSLVATLGFGCSKPTEEDAPAPTQEARLKRRTQALGSSALVEIAVSPEVTAAAGEGARVRAFQIEANGEAFTMAQLAAAALEKGASDPVGLPWELKEAQEQDGTRASLKYLEGLLPAIEAQVGTQEAPRSVYHHWWREMFVGSCGYGDFHSVHFEQSGKLFIIETSGQTAC